MLDTKDPLKEKFRRDADPDLDAELDAALQGLEIDDLIADSTPATSAGGRTGAIAATVVEVDRGNNDVLVDLGGKDQGLVPLDQFDPAPSAGDEVEVEIEHFDHQEGLYALRRKGEATANLEWANLHPGQIVEGLVTKLNKGGLELELGKLRAFMPAGQVDTEFHADLGVFVGQRLKGEVTKVDRQARNLILSRRNILEREQAEGREKLLEEIDVDQTRRGVVKRVFDFGAFVDLGGMDGLLHVSEMALSRHTKAEDVVKVGDVVDVRILKLDRETGKMSLSLRALMADPWQDAATKYPVGSPVTGRVVKVENFGAFVEVEEGMEGLLPVSEIAWQRIGHPKDVVSDGQMLRLLVIGLDPLEKKVTLSLKQAGEDPWKGAESKYPKHSTIDARVTRVVDFGAFAEVEPGLEGLIHVSELSDRRVRSPGDVVRPGQTVTARVLDVDAETRRLSLSLKQATAAPASVEVIGPGENRPAGDGTAVRKKPRPALRGGLER